MLNYLWEELEGSLTANARSKLLGTPSLSQSFRPIDPESRGLKGHDELIRGAKGTLVGEL